MEELFERTKRRQNCFEDWLKISAFGAFLVLSEKDMLVYFAASISVLLITLFEIGSIVEDENIKKSLTFCIGCVERAASLNMLKGQ